MNPGQLSTLLAVILWLAIFIAGAALGSFATVLEARIPDGESIVSPASKCPNCGRSLTWKENIPILGWIMLRGECKGCGQPISRKYPLTELTTAVLFTAAFTPGPLPHFEAANLATAVMAIITVPLTLIDVRLHRLPNPITYSAAIALFAINLGSALTASDFSNFVPVLLAGLIPAAALFTIALISRGGMGLGDVKLAVVLGWAAGLSSILAVFATFVIAFAIGGLYAIGVLLAKKADRKAAIPFGPFLLAGFWIAFLGGNFLQNIVLSPWGL
jgi:leader peptidase (prepilin peptidase)/N-methyltransferase